MDLLLQWAREVKELQTKKDSLMSKALQASDNAIAGERAVVADINFQQAILAFQMADRILKKMPDIMERLTVLEIQDMEF